MKKVRVKRGGTRCLIHHALGGFWLAFVSLSIQLPMYVIITIQHLCTLLR